MSDQITQTPLEREVDAFVATIAAWCYPADVEQRLIAINAGALAGIDYLESIAQTMESTGCSADTARYVVAVTFMARIADLRAKGAAPRPGILVNGKRADGLGRDPDSYVDQDADE